MFRTSQKQDYILRLIEELRRLVQGMMGKVDRNEDAAEQLAQARASVAELLGPMAEVAQRMDSATAAQMVNDPFILHAWAEVTAAEAHVHRASGDVAAAGALARRALELAEEAHRRTLQDEPELLALIDRLRAQVDEGSE